MLKIRATIHKSKHKIMPLTLQAFNINNCLLNTAVSLDMRIVNVYVFRATWVPLHPDFKTHEFGHCVLFSGKKVTAPRPPSPKVPSRLCSLVCKLCVCSLEHSFIRSFVRSFVCSSVRPSIRPFVSRLFVPSSPGVTLLYISFVRPFFYSSLSSLFP